MLLLRMTTAPFFSFIFLWLPGIEDNLCLISLTFYTIVSFKFNSVKTLVLGLHQLQNQNPCNRSQQSV
jgi:hypothetical protein